MTTVVVAQDQVADLLVVLGQVERPTVLVDRGSYDGTVATVRRAYPDVEVVVTSRRTGPAEALAVGTARARDAWVAVVPPDAWHGPAPRPQAVPREHLLRRGAGTVPAQRRRSPRAALGGAVAAASGAVVALKAARH